MKSIIVIADSSNTAGTDSLLEQFDAIPDSETILLAATQPSGRSTRKFIQMDDSAAGTSLALAIEMATGETILIVRSGTKCESWSELASSIDPRAALTWFSTQTEEEIIELQDATAAAMLKTVTSNSSLPITALAIRRDSAPKTSLLTDPTLNASLAKILINSICNFDNIQHSTAQVEVKHDEIMLSQSARAACLKTLTNVSNIEELFPEYAWATMGKESAAASYQTLAAHFIRLQDVDSALDCLRLSDQLEDSPRSLALKGFIALRRGEILGAVANMVSSLQQYEIRKKENDQHFTKFSPSDIEVISDNLRAGLHALNRRDNEGALDHFAEAVFGFDPFYSKLGIDRAIQ